MRKITLVLTWSLSEYTTVQKFGVIIIFYVNITFFIQQGHIKIKLIKRVCKYIYSVIKISISNKCGFLRFIFLRILKKKNTPFTKI